MFEWLCILCLFLLFCIPKPIHRPDLVPTPPTSRAGPQGGQRGGQVGVALRYFYLGSPPPFTDAWYFGLIHLSFFSISQVQSRILRDEILVRIFSD
jgi:hypothetical protein